MIWEVSGNLSSKHLSAYIRFNSDKLFEHSSLSSLSWEVKEKLLKISPATIDRLLKPVREKAKLGGKYKENPYSSQLKKSVPIESHSEKSKETGTLEMDLVHHCGESLKGEFLYTLTATEITTDWTEFYPLKNKAMVWTVKGLEYILSVMPMGIERIHIDNGVEFLNAHVFKFCAARGIELRRSRPYRKNDAPYVESKNWSLVMRHTGWRRYDTDEEEEILYQLLTLLALRHNLFTPTMKLIGKERENGKVRKVHDVNTPYERVIALASLS